MKKFNDIRVKIDEETGSFSSWRVGPLGGDNAVDTPDVAIFDVTHPESIQRINAYLSEAQRAVVDPTSIVRQIQRKLSLIGLQFHLSAGQLKGVARNGSGADSGQSDGNNSWTEEYKLTYLGGRYGVLDTQGTIGHDDNITHRRGQGLKLRIEYYSTDSGKVMVKPKVVNENEPIPAAPSIGGPVAAKPRYTTTAQLKRARK